MKLGKCVFGVMLALGLIAHAAADELRNPDGFNTPQDHVIKRSQVEDFAQVGPNATFVCTSTSKSCTEKDGPFDKNGQLKAEGKVESVTYGRADGKDVSGLQLQRSYERVIKQMGGRLVAVMFGQSEKTGQMRQVYLIELKDQKKWIFVDTRSQYTLLNLSVITETALPDILNAGEFKTQLDTQGYVTLKVNFDTNKSVVLDGDKPTLDQVVSLLASSPDLRLSVDGHTDNDGNAAANKQLSQQRAEAIVAYLVNAGVAKDRLAAKGFGSETPLADNRTEEGRAKNRRVELVKLKPSVHSQSNKPTDSLLLSLLAREAFMQQTVRACGGMYGDIRPDMEAQMQSWENRHAKVREQASQALVMAAKGKKDAAFEQSMRVEKSAMQAKLTGELGIDWKKRPTAPECRKVLDALVAQPVP